MKNYTITVNGTVYDVAVEEKVGGSSTSAGGASVSAGGASAAPAAPAARSE